MHCCQWHQNMRNPPFFRLLANLLGYFRACDSGGTESAQTSKHSIGIQVTRMRSKFTPLLNYYRTMGFCRTVARGWGFMAPADYYKIAWAESNDQVLKVKFSCCGPYLLSSGDSETEILWSIASSSSSTVLCSLLYRSLCLQHPYTWHAKVLSCGIYRTLCTTYYIGRVGDGCTIIIYL